MNECTIRKLFEENYPGQLHSSWIQFDVNHVVGIDAVVVDLDDSVELAVGVESIIVTVTVLVSVSTSDLGDVEQLNTEKPRKREKYCFF